MSVLDKLRTSLSDRYRIERQIGVGSMATVHLARDLRHDRPVAIKLLSPELGTMPFDKRKQWLDTMAPWNAGFIEAAQDLHLAAKPMFLVAICQWGADPVVAAKFANNTVGGAGRLTSLLELLERIRTKAEKQLAAEGQKPPHFLKKRFGSTAAS